MQYHRYPPRSLIWDYCRAAGGFLVAIVPLLLGAPGLFFLVLLLTLAALFLGYGLRTLRMQLTAYELLPEGIASHGPLRRFHRWDQISQVRLRYYATTRDKSRRDLKRGWLELKIVSPAGTMRIDSGVEGFDIILDAVADAAERHNIELDETTEENIKVFRGEGPEGPPDSPAHPPDHGGIGL
jgi:hypothetical protein